MLPLNIHEHLVASAEIQVSRNGIAGGLCQIQVGVRDRRWAGVGVARRALMTSTPGPALTRPLPQRHDCAAKIGRRAVPTSMVLVPPARSRPLTRVMAAPEYTSLSLSVPIMLVPTVVPPTSVLPLLLMFTVRGLVYAAKPPPFAVQATFVPLVPRLRVSQVAEREVGIRRRQDKENYWREFRRQSPPANCRR